MDCAGALPAQHVRNNPAPKSINATRVQLDPFMAASQRLSYSVEQWSENPELNLVSNWPATSPWRNQLKWKMLMRLPVLSITLPWEHHFFLCRFLECFCRTNRAYQGLAVPIIIII